VREAEDTQIPTKMETAQERQYPVDAATERAMLDVEPKGLGMSLDDLMKNQKRHSAQKGGAGGGGRGGDRLKVGAAIRKQGGAGGGDRGGDRGGGFGGRGNSAGRAKVRLPADSNATAGEHPPPKSFSLISLKRINRSFFPRSGAGKS